MGISSRAGNTSVTVTVNAISLVVLIGIGIAVAVKSVKPLLDSKTDRQKRDEDACCRELQTIGIVRSCYRLCVGTPRQGMLAPHARGRIELTVDKEALDGLSDFGYLWIVFGFHLNTVGAKTRTKIAAPARGTLKRVGVLATRSPHRFNCVGITLAKLDGVDWIERRTERGKLQRIPCVRISGHDLVDGTPVYDIKPYVAYYDAVVDASVPEWVGEGLKSHRTVHFVESALVELDALVPYLEFYNSSADIRSCIEEVLAVDVRSAWQTKKARLGQFQAERSQRLMVQTTVEDTELTPRTGVCTQQLDNLLILYTIEEAETVQRRESVGSGAEDMVTVQSIRLLS